MATLRLVPVSGGNAIEIVKDPTMLGREPSVDVLVSDGSVSRRHARIEQRGGVYFVVDQGSANGTFVNTERIAERELKDGQTLRIGAVDFKVELEDDLAATIAMPSEAARPTAATAPSLQPAPPVAAPPPAPRPAPPPPVAAPPPAPPPAPAPAPRAAPPARPSAPPPPPGGARVSAAPAAAPVGSMGTGAPPPAKKGKGPVFWGFVGCCGCLLLAGLVAGGFFGYLFVATQGPVTAVQEMLKELKAGQSDAAYARLSSGYQARLDPSDFTALVAAHPGLNDNKDASFSSRSITNGRAVLKDVVLTSNAGTTEQASFELIEEGGAWKIDALTLGAGSDTPVTGGGGQPSGGLQVTVADVTKTRDGDAIKVVIDVTASGYKVRPREGGGFDVDLKEAIVTSGPDGKRIDTLSNDEIEHREATTNESDPPPTQSFSTTLTVDPSNTPGLYTVKCTIHDLIGGDSQTQVANFSLP